MIYPFEKKLGQSFPITMRFGDPANWYKEGKHLGVDWAMPKGTPLISVFDGVISRIEPYRLVGYGRSVYLRSSDGRFEAIYGHMSQIATWVKPGVTVKEDRIIGLSGNTGTVFGKNGGYHLHFSLLLDGKQVDPLPYLNGQLFNSSDYLKKKPEYITEGYVVKAGDTLSSIAKAFYNNGNLWQKIYNANRAVLDSPSLIRPGQVLKIPGFE